MSLIEAAAIVQRYQKFQKRNSLVRDVVESKSHHLSVCCYLECNSRPTHPLGPVWTAPWQELSDISAALVGCGHVSGLLMRRGWPLALMLCADRLPIVLCTRKCDDPSGFSRSPERPYLHYVVMPSPIR